MANQVVPASVHRRVVMAVMPLAWQLRPTAVSYAGSGVVPAQARQRLAATHG